MARYTITPWKTPADLLIVRRQLYNLEPSAPDARRHAVDRIMAWKLRSNLPHAVESTALLIDAILHNQNATEVISEFSIRAVYAAAFTRFVTGFCDIGRAREKGLEQSSMLVIAKQIGMPPDFVALRHEATHEELPGLKRMIGAVEAGLEWLWRVYWSGLEEGKSEAERVEEVRWWKGEAGSLLRSFRRERRDGLKKGIDGEEQVAKACQNCVELCGGRKEGSRLLAEVLVEERLLLPTTRRLSDPMDGAFLIWDGLLQSISGHFLAFRLRLAQTMFEAITRPTESDPQADTDKDGLLAWLLHSMEGRGTNGHTTRARETMKWCCLHPGYWTQMLGSRVLETADEEVRSEWQEIFEASLISDRNVASLLDAGVTQSEADANAMDVEIKLEGRIARGGWRKAALPSSLPIGVVA